MSMRVCLVGNSHDRGMFKEVYSALKQIGIPAFALGLTPHWSSRRDLLADRLRSASHLIVFVKDLENWYSFVEGFASACYPRGIAYAPEPLQEKLVSSENPTFHPLTILPLFTKMEGLVEFLESENQRLTREEKLRKAREYIIEAGIGLSDENFSRCVQEGKADLVEQFLALGYSPDTVNEKGVPLLILAIRNRHKGIAELLIRSNANVNAVSADRGSSALMEASVWGENDLVEKLLEHGADPNLRSKNGQTALMLAIGEGKKDIALTLIDRGADLTAADSLGMTAKKYAELFRQPELLALIQERMKEGEHESR